MNEAEKHANDEKLAAVTAERAALRAEVKQLQRRLEAAAEQVRVCCPSLSRQLCDYAAERDALKADLATSPDPDYAAAEAWHEEHDEANALRADLATARRQLERSQGAEADCARLVLEREEILGDVKAVRVYIDAADRLATAVRAVPYKALNYEQSYSLGMGSLWSALADYDAARRKR